MRISVLCLTLGLVASACGPAPVRLAWLANDPQNTYDNAILAGIKDATDPSQSTVDAFYAAFDPDMQSLQCKQLLESKRHDGMFIIAADPIKIVSCAMAAYAAGVAVAAVDLPIGPDPVTVQPQVLGQVAASFIPASAFGSAVGAIVPEVCAGLSSCNIFYLAGVSSFPAEKFSIEQLRQAAAANPSIHLLGDAEAFYDTTTARQVVTDALAAHPTVNVVIALGDQMALGAEQAAADVGAMLRIVGGGAGASALAAVRTGRWFATANALPRTEGRLAAELLLQALRHPNTPPTGKNPIEDSGLPIWWTQITLAQHPEFMGEWPGP